MEPTKELIDSIYREKVLRARRMSPEEKILEGFRLFDEECKAMAAEIRREHPGADEEQVQGILRQRLESRRRLEEAGLYVSVPATASPTDANAVTPDLIL